MSKIHTWVYKKVSAMSEINQKNIIETQLKRLRNSWIMRLSFDQAVKLVEEDPEIKEDPYKWVKRNKEKYQLLIEGLQEKGIEALDPYEESLEIIKYKGEIYYIYDYNEPLIVYGNPKETFDNKKDLKKWLKRTKNEFGYYDGEQKTFIKGYSKTLENLIDEYFSKNGENNLYIEF